MTTADDQLRDANWARMRTALDRAATEYRRIADDLDAINFVSTAGRLRSPDAIISQAALTADPGRTHADLMHRLATCSGVINDLNVHSAQSRDLCGYTIDDPVTSCVLDRGHQLPTDSGMVVHVNEHGGTFL